MILSTFRATRLSDKGHLYLMYFLESTRKKIEQNKE